MKILLKSWGTNRSGLPLASVIPVLVRASLISSRTAGAADGVVLCSVMALEQQRHRRVPHPFVVVVGGHQRHCAVLAADPGDDLAEHVGQLGADDQEPLGVGLGRGDLQQRDQLAGGRQLVLDEAVVGQLGEFLDPDAGVAEDLDRGPGPERLVLFEGEVAVLAAAGVLCPGPAGGGVGPGWPAQGLAGRGEQLAGRGALGGAQPFCGCLPVGVHFGQQRGKDRDALAGPLVHP